MAGRNVHAKSLQGVDSVGHETFTTGLIDWRREAVSNSDFKSALPRGQRRREACRPASNHKYFGLVGQFPLPHHSSATSSEQNQAASSF